ncbi:MAG TPA: rRNA maturation RNase YbeY [Terriglobales bacterium]|nr:rRNA maturation RNase YbeY [Terriglobales bacterium]
MANVLPFPFSHHLIIMHKQVPGAGERALARFTERARRAAGVGKLNVLVTSGREIRRLNHRFRGKDTSTDVLSFPAEPSAPSDLAGEIAISAETAIANARRLRHSTLDEFKILILHGVIHLAGYDHEHDNGEMAREEARLRKRLGLPDALIARAHSSAHSRPARNHSARRVPARSSR